MKIWASTKCNQFPLFSNQSRYERRTYLRYLARAEDSHYKWEQLTTQIWGTGLNGSG